MKSEKSGKRLKRSAPSTSAAPPIAKRAKADDDAHRGKRRKQTWLSDEIWAKILQDVDDRSLHAFARTSKQMRRVQQDSGRKLETWLGQKTNGMVTQCDTFTGVPPKLVPLSESWLEWNYDDLTASPAEGNELMVVKKFGSYPRAYVRMRKTTKAQSEIANAASRRGHVNLLRKIVDTTPQATTLSGHGSDEATTSSSGPQLESIPNDARVLSFVVDRIGLMTNRIHNMVDDGLFGHVVNLGRQAAAPVIRDLVLTLKTELTNIYGISEAMSKHCPVLPDTAVLGEETVAAAAAGNHLPVIKVLKDAKTSWSEEACVEAAAGGHLGLLKWLLSKSKAKGCGACPFEENGVHKAALGAARSGHTHILQYLKRPSLTQVFHMSVPHAAAEGGRLETLQFFRELNLKSERNWYHFGMWDDKRVCEIGARYGHLHIVEWLVRLRHDRPLITCEEAAEGGHLEILMWLRSQGCPWGPKASLRAAKGGHLHVLRHLHENGCPWDASVCGEAAERGYLDVLKYLRENECPWDETEMCLHAANRGDLEMLRYCREQWGCPWDEDAIVAAARVGALDVVRYMREDGADPCPWSARVTTQAAQFNRLDVLQFARAAGCPCQEERLCLAAAARGQLPMLKWLIESEKCPWNRQECLNKAGKNKHTRVVEYLESIQVDGTDSS